MITQFEEITRKRTVSFVCQSCAKPKKRVLSVTHTINPYNQNPDGTVRTPGEVLDCVRGELDALVAKTTTCATCSKTKSWPQQLPPKLYPGS